MIIFNSIIRKKVSKIILVFVFSLGFNFSLITVSNAENTVGVLIAAELSPVNKTSVLEIRRLFLGLPSSSDNLIKNTVINLSDPVAYKDFLKNIMHMTDSGYRRKIVKRIFRQGGKKVNEIDDIEEIVNYLTDNPYDVSFMTANVAKKTKGIKVIQVLW